MADRLKRRGRKRSHLDSPWAVLGFGILAVSMAYYAFGSFLREMDVKDEQNLLNQQIKKRTAAIAEIKTQIERVKSGEGLELEARSRLNLRKPGEKVLIILDDKDEKPETADDKKGFWERVAGWFGGN